MSGSLYTVVYTTEPDNDDVRRMIVSQGMFNQRFKMYQDSLGRPYLQRSDGLCYATSTSKIYTMCEVRQVDRNGDILFYGDLCLTNMKYFEPLEAEIGISRGRLTSSSLANMSLQTARTLSLPTE